MFEIPPVSPNHLGDSATVALPIPARGVHPAAVVCWAFILLVAFALPTLSALAERQQPATTRPTTTEAMEQAMTAKWVVGGNRLAPGAAGSGMKEIDAQAQTDTHRVLAAIVAGELEGVDSALKRLEPIANDDAAAVRTWYSEKQATPAFDDFRSRYPYHADLATVAGRNDSDPLRQRVLGEARQMAIKLIAIGIAGFAGGATAVGLSILALVQIAREKLSLKSTPPGRKSHVYVEGFAIYLGGFLGGSVAMELLLPAGSPMLLRVLPLLGVIALGAAWPLIRGVGWADYRRDVGFHAGQNVFVEIAAGAGGYLACLPIVGIGILYTYVLQQVGGVTVSDPIQDEIAKANPYAILALAAVFAPLTEELMFRGLLMANLRAVWGVVASGLINGFVFAAIHPQGWAGIPALMAIGFVMAILRAWRGSLVAPITAHALNNGTLVLLMLLLLK